MIEHSLLLTDFHELAMLEAYAVEGMVGTAVFELFVRRLPPGRGFLLAAGLAQAADFLEALRFRPDELAWLRASNVFAPGFLDDLAALRFSGLDEQHLLEFCGDGAPIDGFGIGTSLVTSSDAPALDCAYKLQEYAGHARRKRSEGKATWPGRKQVYRRFAADGTPLLQPAMRKGRRVAALPDLAETRRHAAVALAQLPAPLRRLEPGEVTVEISPGIRDLAAEIDRGVS